MENKDARLTMIYLANLISVPMSLHAAVKLHVPELVWQGGANLPISPKELAGLIKSKLGLPTEPDAVNLERILRVLGRHGVFEEASDGGNQGARTFRLTQVGQILLPDEQGRSFGAYILRNYQDAFLQAWPHLYESVLDPSKEAFRKVHGVAAYEYYTNDSASNLLMQRAMSGLSLPFMRAVLDNYDGFASEGLKRIVEVGGSSGSCVALIVERYPGLEGINFDLPGVVADAPHYNGVTHIGGDMFDSVPAGDAIFIKGVLISFSDEECKKVLKNCYEALPEDGKLILCDTVVPEEADDSERTRMMLVEDIFLMAIYAADFRNRTESEYRRLGEAAGFGGFRAFYNFDHLLTLMEFKKQS